VQPQCQCAARIRDISVSGALVHCRQPIALGSQVRLNLSGVVLPGRVVRMTRTGILGVFRRGYLHGVITSRPWPNEIFSRIAFPQARTTPR
jgi:hypothetical protein